MQTAQENHSNPGIETFDSLPSSAEDSGMAYANDGIEKQSQPEGIETFDDIQVAAPTKVEKSTKAEKTAKKDDVKFLEDQEGEKKEEVAAKEESKDGEPTEAKKEDGQTEQKADEKSTEAVKPKGKVFKAKVGDDLVDIPAQAVVPVKVNGKVTEVPVQDLVNNYSGKVMYEQKFQEVSKEKKELSEQQEYFKGQVDSVKSIVGKVQELLDKEDGDPLDALYYLLDKTGRNVVQYKQKLFQSSVDKFNEYLNMDELERKLYWTKEENEFLRKRTESEYSRQQEERQRHEFVSKVDKLRETHGVSEEQYITTLNELYALGYTAKEATPEAVVNYAVLKPHIDEAEKLVEPYVDLMDDSAISSLLEELAVGFKDKTFSVDEARATLEKHYGSTQAVKELNQKAPVETKVPKSTSSSTQIESFDDFETTY